MKINNIVASKGMLPLFFVGMLALSTLLSSCQKRVDTTLEWRRENEKAFEDYAQKSDYQKVSTDGLYPFIYMRWMERGEGKEYPIETSRVLVHYECYLLAGSQTLQDGNFDQEKSMRLTINRGTTDQTVKGFQIALQNMVVGDYAEAIVPWHLAYGTTAKGSIQAYSGLRFQIRLDSIIPESAP